MSEIMVSRRQAGSACELLCRRHCSEGSRVSASDNDGKAEVNQGALVVCNHLRLLLMPTLPWGLVC